MRLGVRFGLQRQKSQKKSAEELSAARKSIEDSFPATESSGAFLCKKFGLDQGRGVRGQNLENHKFGDFDVSDTSGADFERKIDVGFALRAMF